MNTAHDTLSWVVDHPWGSACCTAADYKTTFKKKMEAWSLAGKRVVFNNVPVDPQGSVYTIGFLTGVILPRMVRPLNLGKQ
jgi:hypothetical protein